MSPREQALINAFKEIARAITPPTSDPEVYLEDKSLLRAAFARAQAVVQRTIIQYPELDVQVAVDARYCSDV